MSKSHLAAPLRGSLVAVAAATALLAPAAHAVASPVVTGIDQRWIVNISDPLVTVSGSGFTGATAVDVGGPSGTRNGTFTVVDDHTITAHFNTGGPNGFVHVTAGGATSPDNAAARISRWVGPDRHNLGGASVTCRLGDAGTPFDAGLSTEFVGPDLTGQPAGTSPSLGTFRADLIVAARAAGVPDPLAPVVGNATVTSIDADVTGAAQSSIDLAAVGAPFSFPVATSVDGNKLDFEVAGSGASTLDLSPTVGTTTVTLHGYHARVTLAGGGTSSLDCLPKASSTGALLRISRTAPAPTVTGIAPASGPSTGGTRVHFSGSGFVTGMPVRFNGVDASDVQVTSTGLDATTPAVPAGNVTVQVGTDIGASGSSTTFTYVGSVPAVPVAKTIPLTCNVSDPPGDAGVAHPSLVIRGDVQPSALPNEAVGIGNAAVTLNFGAADVDALRAATFDTTYLSSLFASFSLHIAGSTRAGDTTDLHYGAGQPQPPFSPHGTAPFTAGLFGGLPAGSSASLAFNFHEFENTGSNAYNFGLPTGGVGSAVTVSLRPFEFTEAGPNPHIACSPDGDAEFLHVPIVDGPPASTPLDLALKGGVVLKSPAKGTVTLAGGLSGALTGSSFAGALSLKPTSAHLTAYGFIPVTTAFTFTQASATTGSLTGGTLTTASKVLVHVPSLRVLGLQIGGAGCQAKAPSDLSLTAKGFSTATGGLLTGALPINGLTGCGANTNIASSLLTSTAHSVAIKATPNAPAAS